MKRLVGIFATGFIACSIVSCNHSPKPTVAPPVRVKTAVAQLADVSAERTYSGTVEESNGSALSFAVAGTIRNINVNVGDRVSRGQLIATLDASNLGNSYAIAQSALDQAQDAYNRMKVLHNAGALPDMQWVQVQNTLKQAQSAAAIARKGMSDANLYASVSGYVSEKLADAGQNIAPGIPVVKIVDINPVKVSISIPENEISQIADKDKAYITAGALGGKRFEGTITQKAVSANPISRAYEVKITVANPDGELLPGMICDVALAGDSVAHAMVLPISSVLLDSQNQNFVWVADKGVARRQPVTVGGLTDSGIIISGGLNAGDSIIVEGLQKVSAGMKVESINK